MEQQQEERRREFARCPSLRTMAHGELKEFAMPRGGYSDVSWFLRVARVAPVIAGAALLGGMIGGFAMFAIDSALTWEPVSQPRLDARADNQPSAAVTQATKPVRVVGGAIPDPSAGMSAPPPAPQQQNAAAPAQSPAQVSPQLLTPKPLGPASRLQSQTATAGPISGAPQQNQTANQPPVPTQAATATEQPTRWPDALSRAHQNAANAANANSAQQQTVPPPTSARAASKSDAIDRKEASGDRAAATADDQDRAYTFRHGRHSRRHTIFGANGWRNGGDDDAAASSPRRQDARTYDRLYDSYGNRRDRSYGNRRERSYGDARGDQDDAASRSDASRSEMRRFGRDERYRGRSRAITREQARKQPGETDRTQAFEAARPRSEPFWGGGFFRRGDRDDD
jgi:hypothetical protein